MKPWVKKPGSGCTFYYEGGHGAGYWSGGWHYGIISELPDKGIRKGMARIELPSDHYAVEEKHGRRVRRVLPHEKVWVSAFNVNEPGDFFYHGPKLVEVVKERAEEKKAHIEAAARIRAGKKPKAKVKAKAKAAKRVR